MGGATPANTLTALCAARRAMAARVSCVAEPRCGMSTAFSHCSRPGCTAGSFSNTSRPAPAIWPLRSASTDKADVEIEGLLLEVLGEFQVTIPELGTIKAKHRPFVVLTSNATRELSEALRRRCLFLHIDFPDPELEQQIVRLKVPELDSALGDSLVRVINSLRAMPLRKAPSISESI